MNITALPATAIFLLAVSVCSFADDTTGTAPSGDTTVAVETAATPAAATGPVDSAASPEKTADSDIAAVPATEKSPEPVLAMEDLDTVFIFDKSVFRFVARDWRNNIGIFRQRGYGLSGSSMYGANAIFTGPIKDLAEHDPRLAGKQFNFSRFACEPFLVSGGMGYVGLGDGFRLGGGGMNGQRKFTSNRFNGDSILVLNTQVSYGGFLIEKCMIKGKWNLSAGGEIGGGGFNVALSEQAGTFFHTSESSTIDFDVKDRNTTTSLFFMLQPHAALTYTFFYFFHVGASVSLPAFMSIEKFNAYTDDYFTVNPGLQIKLIFGNLG
jgi:hypothetical protein